MLLWAHEIILTFTLACVYERESKNFMSISLTWVVWEYQKKEWKLLLWKIKNVTYLSKEDCAKLIWYLNEIISCRKDVQVIEGLPLTVQRTLPSTVSTCGKGFWLVPSLRVGRPCLREQQRGKQKGFSNDNDVADSWAQGDPVHSQVSVHWLLLCEMSLSCTHLCW